jgi:hypothetical protein
MGLDLPRRGDVAIMALPGGGYGACQVSGVDGDVVTAYALDWYSAQPSDLARLPDVEPLLLDHHVHDAELAIVGVACSAFPVPPGLRWLGARPVPDEVPSSSGLAAGWDYLPVQVADQRRWDREVPAEARAAYRAARTRGPVRVDFGAGPVTLGAATRRLDLTEHVPARGDVRWAALDDLPRCTVLTWSGPDRGLADALAARPVVSSLEWRDAPPDVDLTGSGLTHLTLRGPGMRGARLPRNLTLLHVDGPLEVRAAEDGRCLRLIVETTGPEVRVSGLDQVRHLRIEAAGTLSATPLAGLTGLETLTIRWRRPPHLLADAEALRRLEHLHTVELIDAYGLAPTTLPDLPALALLAVHGLRRSVVAGLRTRYRKTAVRAVITGAKADTWLEATITNPFRDWVEDDARGGAAACEAFADTLRALDRLPPDAPDRLDQTEHTLRRFVHRLNEIADRYQCVDTPRREEAGDAFVALACRHGVPAESADSWFDATRTF